MKHDSFNESAEMYLKAVTELAGPVGPVPISALAERLGVSSVSATEMVHRLSAQGLIAHTRYQGVDLTDIGSRQATAIVRNHRLWERFLTDCLGLPWHIVHDIACRLEHATDPFLADALDLFLGRPMTCPHGNPIPSGQGVILSSSDNLLSELEPGRKATITRIYPESEVLLAYLDAHNLRPATMIRVVDIMPFGGPIVLQVGPDTHYIGQEAAAHIHVEQSTPLHETSPGAGAVP